MAAIVKSGRAEAANLNVDVALCLIPPEVPVMVTSYALGTIEVQESVAWPEPFEILAGLIPVHTRSFGTGRLERVTVPVKPSKGFTMMVDVAGVVPSASTVIGEDASREKSGIEIGLNVKEDVASSSTPCGTILGQTARLNANSSNRIVIRG